MKEYFDLHVWIMDYQKDMLDRIEEYNHVEMYREIVQKEAERLRSIYAEMTNKAVYSEYFKTRDGKCGTKYFYATKEEYDEMQEKKYWWWSDLLSVTVGND